MDKKLQRTARPSLFSGLAVSVVTILLALLIVEGGLRWIPKNNPYEWERRLMFFTEGSNFRNNEWGGFSYQPDATVRVQTFYITDLSTGKLVKEYDYAIKTNSYGFIQMREITAGKPAVIFLGDSFTEGQGGRPWFYDLENNWPKDSRYQIINGGILGSGFEWWERLYRNISFKIEIEKAVIIFISDDWTRGVWQLSPQTLACLKAAASCEGKEDFYGLPSDLVAAKAQIDKIARVRIDLLKGRSGLHLFERTALYQKLWEPAYRRVKILLQMGDVLTGSRFRPVGKPDAGNRHVPFDEQVEVNERAAAKIVDALGRDNVIFIHLPQRDELGSGPNWFGRKGREYIHKKQWQFVDGFQTCGLGRQDFLEHDGHPNAGGYTKIATCIDHGIKKFLNPL